MLVRKSQSICALICSYKPLPIDHRREPNSFSSTAPQYCSRISKSCCKHSPHSYAHRLGFSNATELLCQASRRILLVVESGFDSSRGCVVASSRSCSCRGAVGLKLAFAALLKISEIVGYVTRRDIVSKRQVVVRRL